MKTQQCCVLIGAFGEILLGTLLAVASTWSMDSSPVLHHMEPAFAPLALALGGAVCAVGCLGACGACCTSRPALCLYGALTLLLAVAAFVLGGALLATVNGHGEEIRRSCSMDQSTGQIYSSLAAGYQASYDSMQQALKNCRRNRQAALGLQDC